MPHLDDDAIRAIARDGRDAAHAHVVTRHRPRLVRLATSIVKDRDLAGDIVQDVFIKALHEPRFFDEGFRMGAWLYRVTRNLCLNTVRDRRRRGDILAAMPTPRSAAPKQVDAVYADERHDAIRDAMDHLSQDHRRILHERFYEDLSYAEIAEVLGLKLGTVMSRLSRAKRALHDVLEGHAMAEL